MMCIGLYNYARQTFGVSYMTWNNPIFNNMAEGLKIVRSIDAKTDYEQLRHILKHDAFNGYDPALLESLK